MSNRLVDALRLEAETLTDESICNLLNEAADEIVTLGIEKRTKVAELEAEVHELRQKYVVTKPVSYPLQGYWRN